jgi:hypothetical protein
MSNAAHAESSKTLAAYLIAVIVFFLLLPYLSSAFFLFIAGMEGFVRQIANPEALYETNVTILVAMWPGFVVIAYVFLPEFNVCFRERVLISLPISVLGMVALAAVLAATLPALAFYEPMSFAAALFLIFLGFGIFPCLLCTRLVAVLHPGLRVGRQGDHYADPGALEGDIRRIVSKHTGGTFRRPLGWPSRSFFGDGGRLTHRDVVRMIESETEEIRAATTATTVRAQAIEDEGAKEETAAKPKVLMTWVERALDLLGVTALLKLRARDAELRAELQKRTVSLGQAVSEYAYSRERIAEYERQLTLLTKQGQEQEGIEASLRARIAQLEGQLAQHHWSQNRPTGGSHAF